MIIGYIIETTYGIITMLNVEGYDSKYWHSCTHTQGIYLFKNKCDAVKIARKFRNEFRINNKNYHTYIHTVRNTIVR